MSKKPSNEYLDKANLLTKEEAERLLSRVRSKLMRRLDDKRLSEQEVVAIQLEIEDEALNEWRKKMSDISSTTNRS